MLETFEAKKPFYPLISFSVSVIVLIFGMLFSNNLLAFAFATAIFANAGPNPERQEPVGSWELCFLRLCFWE